MYQEIEITVLGKEGERTPQSININNINYYRSYIDTKKEGKDDKLMTVVYFQGSIKGTFVECSYQDFKRLIDKARVGE
jgi:hypothetical protein